MMLVLLVPCSSTNNVWGDTRFGRTFPVIYLTFHADVIVEKSYLVGFINVSKNVTRVHVWMKERLVCNHVL
jgi:hypothetical protein